MCALSARRGTRVKHPLSGFEIEPIRGTLRAEVLHRDFALDKTRKPIDRQWTFEQQRFCSTAARLDAVPGKVLLISFDIGTAAVDTQAHRRLAVACIEHLLPISEVRRLHEIYPPVWVLVSRHDVVRDLPLDRRAFAQKTP